MTKRQWLVPESWNVRTHHAVLRCTAERDGNGVDLTGLAGNTGQGPRTQDLVCHMRNACYYHQLPCELKAVVPI